MVIDFNSLSVASHFQSVAANKIRATVVMSAVRKNPSLIAAMYAVQPSWIHELPLDQVAHVAEELCDAGFTQVVTDMSENRAVQKDYREVLGAIASGESIVT
jgi:hypothetical protein